MTPEDPLREAYHRIKNHLQMVSSLIELQASDLPDPSTRDQLHRLQRRVFAIALVWDVLQRGGERSEVDLVECLTQLASALHAQIQPASSPPRLELEAAKLPIDRALPLVLVASELMANAFEHGGRREARCAEPPSIRLRTEAAEPPPGCQRIRLVVRDHGAGFPPGFDLAEHASMGLRLVEMLCDQLSARLDLASSDGAVVTVTVPQVQDD